MIHDCNLLMPLLLADEILEVHVAEAIFKSISRQNIVCRGRRMDGETLEFVQRSKYRQKVLKALEDNVLMPKQIAERSGIKTNHVSKVLSELKSKKLIEIINPEARKGRLYRLTSVGEGIVEHL